MKTRLSGTLLWLTAALLVAANVAVMWHSLTIMHFWEDEAFNLTVPRNLIAGWGYTSDGALSGSQLTPFDTRISTGPIVLLPVAALLGLGLDPVMAARLIPLAYWVVLLGGLIVLGHRIAGRWGALVAAATPLAFNTTEGISPIQGPADLLGEIPAAAFIVWALVVLTGTRRRWWLAGLLVGLAVQTKLIALLALPAFAVALFILTPGTRRKRWARVLRSSLLPLAFVALPTLLFELAALATLGLAGYYQHLRDLAWFMLSSGQIGEPTTIPQKIVVFAEAWFLPSIIVFAAAIVIAVAVGVAVRVGVGMGVGGFAGRAGFESNAQDEHPDAASDDSAPSAEPARDVRIALAAGAVVGLFAFVGWWAQASQTPLWVRHPAVGVFAFTPIIAATAVHAIRVLVVSARSPLRGSRRFTLRMLAALAALAVATPLTAGAVGRVAQVGSPGPFAMTLESQREAIEPLAEWVHANDVEWLAANPWGANVAAVVLTGAHVGLWDAPAMRNTPTLTNGACPADILVEGRVYRICAR
ncbi:hypothetical protein [Microbacterium sp. YY-01]|uniref:hypothetical protein n=1 Tax=Microbacterium sp. YY-01 TaxID=3421634 RepID=UPI003D173A5B